MNESDSIATLRSGIRRMLEKSTPDGTVELDAPLDTPAFWNQESAERGQLFIQAQLSRKLDSATLKYLAQLAVPSAIKYRSTMLVDKKNNILRFVKAGIAPEVDEVMRALETLLNQYDVLNTLLIDGPNLKR